MHMIRTVMLTPLMQLCRDGHEVRLLGENERHFIGQML